MKTYRHDAKIRRAVCWRFQSRIGRSVDPFAFGLRHDTEISTDNVIHKIAKTAKDDQNNVDGLDDLNINININTAM